jgi:hypothetical protein
MKIRSGFVSNSSSSSFIVAFSKKPATKEDVLKEMFPKNPNGSIDNPWPGLKEYDDGLTYAQIVEQVFTDLQGESTKVSKTDLLQELAGRYFTIDGKLYYMGAPYYALDKKLAQQYIDVHEEHEARRKAFDTFERELIRKHVGPAVPYASETSTNWTTRKPCTKADIEAYKTYTDAVKAFEESNPKYIAAKKKNNRQESKCWDTQRKLAIRLARVDLKKFLEDNKGRFITRFTYSDNDGEFFSMMEHGNIFRNVNHVYVSHH